MYQPNMKQELGRTVVQETNAEARSPLNLSISESKGCVHGGLSIHCVCIPSSNWALQKQDITTTLTSSLGSHDLWVEKQKKKQWAQRNQWMAFLGTIG